MQLILPGMVMAGAALLSTAAVAEPFHRASIDHAALPVDAAYQLSWKTSLREVYPTPTMRPGLPACRWRADMVLTRDVANADHGAISALTKVVHRYEPLSGIEMGSCESVSARIESGISRRAQALEGDAATVARGDRAVLVTEIDGMASMMRPQGS